MERYLDSFILKDLGKKMVIVTGPRQIGKTTLSKRLMPHFTKPQYLNWDVVVDRKVLLDQSWQSNADLLVFDEIHKMSMWKNWLKGVFDGKASDQAILVTGSARMDTFRRVGDSLAGRFFSYRLQPFSVKEWCELTSCKPQAALAHLIERGGFPEACLAEDLVQANRWRTQYLSGVIRDDILEFSRLRDVNAMRTFVELLRDRVGSPLSLASIARDLGISPATVKTYLEILEALFIVFTIRPWHDNVARALSQTPKVYFYDTGLVRGHDGVRLENAVATMLQKHVFFLQDSEGKEIDLHYLRTKDGAEVDFALSDGRQLTHLIECRASADGLHPALRRFSKQFACAQSVQIVGSLRQEQTRDGVEIRRAADWLAELAA